MQAYFSKIISEDNKTNHLFKKIAARVIVISLLLACLTACGENSENSGNNGNGGVNNTGKNTIGNPSGNIVNGGFIVQQGDWLYHSINYYVMYKQKTDGSDKQEVGESHRAKYINIVGNWIYFNGYNQTSGLHKIKIDGSGIQKITSDNVGSIYVHVIGTGFTI